MVLPPSAGLRVQSALQGVRAGDQQIQIRWYATSQAQPEAATYLRLLSYQNQVPPGQSLGCVLADSETRTATLTDGTNVCLALRNTPIGIGRLAMDRSPFSILIEGNATDDELITAAEHVVTSNDSAFEITQSGLPAGVSESGTGQNVSDFASVSSAVAAQSMLQVNWSSERGDHSIFYVATVDDPSFTSNLRLGFDTIIDISVRGVPGFLRTLPDQPSYLGLVWTENGTTYQVGSQGLTQGQLLDYVEQMRPATNTEWRALLDAANPPDAPSAEASTASTSVG
jgi:hypothetical protein